MTPLDATARQAIANDLDDTLIVEAAAGTGKTTELVNRILRVLATGRARMVEIVAVTFTEKAAGELKLRLREALEVERARAVDAETRDRLEQALETLEEAHVNTIHGFCADLLRERPVEARVDPLFTVLTEPQAKRLYERAFRAWLQESLRQPPEGVRRALRRSAGPAFSAGGIEDSGPIGRLQSAGWDLVEARDYPAPWHRPSWNRLSEIQRLVDGLHQLSDLSAAAASKNDNLFYDLDAVRRLSRQIRLEQDFGTSDLDGAAGQRQQIAVLVGVKLRGLGRPADLCPQGKSVRCCFTGPGIEDALSRRAMVEEIVVGAVEAVGVQSLLQDRRLVLGLVARRPGRLPVHQPDPPQPAAGHEQRGGHALEGSKTLGQRCRHIVGSN